MRRFAWVGLAIVALNALILLDNPGIRGVTLVVAIMGITLGAALTVAGLGAHVLLRRKMRMTP